jgi:dTDP-4-dehydrorhamnose reductase
MGNFQVKAVLIGAQGQLGSDLFKTKPQAVNLTPLEISDLDIRDARRVKDVLGELQPQMVINTAAYVRVDDAEDEVEQAFAVNAAGVRNVAKTCRDIRAILVHISTDYVFDGCKKGIPYDEADRPNPINVYGISKYAGEFFVSNYLEQYYLIRSASLYGSAGARGKGGNFVYTILNKAKDKAELRIVNDIFMSPTYTRDLAQGIWRLLCSQQPYGLYHMTNAGYCSWYEFAQKILEAAGLHAPCVPVPHTEYRTKARRPLWSPLTSTKGTSLRPWETALHEFLSEAKK